MEPPLKGLQLGGKLKIDFCGEDSDGGGKVMATGGPGLEGWWLLNVRGLLVVVLGVLLTLCGCGTAQVSARRDMGPKPVTRPETIYVADFELKAASVRAEAGLLPLPGGSGGPLGELMPSLPGGPKEPETVAEEVVRAMSSTLMRELSKAGFIVRPLRAGEKVPKSGWLVRGVFTEVNQGNQLRRAMIGFGAGKTELQVIVGIEDLALGEPKPFYELNAGADSGKTPGAGPMIVLGPMGAAARFVIAGGDLNRNVKQTAGKIAEEVIARCRAVPGAPGETALPNGAKADQPLAALTAR